MADVRHLGFVMRVRGPRTNGIWWSLSLCKIWLEFDAVVLIICTFFDIAYIYIYVYVYVYVYKLYI